MTGKHDNVKAPHGVTGNTVQQAAEVSRPTSDVGRALDDPRVPQDPPQAGSEGIRHGEIGADGKQDDAGSR